MCLCLCVHACVCVRSQSVLGQGSVSEIHEDNAVLVILLASGGHQAPTQQHTGMWNIRFALP